MALNWSTAGNASVNHGIKVLVYGPAGVGKTRLAGTMPKPIIISAEAGLLTFKKMIADGLLDPETPVLIINTAEELDEAFAWCEKNAVAKGFMSVALDSISEIAERILESEKAKTKDPRQAYGELSVRTIKMVKKFRDLPGLHVLITAKQAEVKDGVTGVVRAAPTTPGQQVGPALPYLFDEVFQAFTDKDPTTGATFHALRTHAAFNADAKDRSGVLDEIEYPDMVHLISKILN